MRTLARSGNLVSGQPGEISTETLAARRAPEYACAPARAHIAGLLPHSAAGEHNLILFSRPKILLPALTPGLLAEPDGRTRMR